MTGNITDGDPILPIKWPCLVGHTFIPGRPVRKPDSQISYHLFTPQELAKRTYSTSFDLTPSLEEKTCPGKHTTYKSCMSQVYIALTTCIVYFGDNLCNVFVPTLSLTYISFLRNGFYRENVGIVYNIVVVHCYRIKVLFLMVYGTLFCVFLSVLQRASFPSLYILVAGTT